MARLTVRTMLGLGDNLWSRPHVLALARLYEPLTLITPWPQVYADLAQRHSLRFARPTTRLRTQSENVARWHGPWAQDGSPAFRLSYDRAKIAKGMTYHDSLEESARPWLKGTHADPTSIRMELPREWQEEAEWLLKGWERDGTGPAVLVRPNTIRMEWRNPARNCDPQALQHLVNRLKQDHTLVGVASIKTGEEWLTSPYLTGVRYQYYRQEIKLETLLALAQQRRTLGSIGFLTAMAVAVGGKSYALFGGNYSYNSPEKLLDSRYPLGGLGYSEPDMPCQGCTNVDHNCSVAIDPQRLDDEFSRWMAE